jgi:hypothetical protein
VAPWAEAAARGEVVTTEEEAQHGEAAKATSLVTGLTDVRRSLDSRRQLARLVARQHGSSATGAAAVHTVASCGRNDEEKMTFSCLGPQWRGIRQP